MGWNILSVQLEAAVTIPRRAADPEPTLVGLVNFRPETDNGINLVICAGAKTRAESFSTSLGTAFAAKESLAAANAVELDRIPCWALATTILPSPGGYLAGETIEYSAANTM